MVAGAETPTLSAHLLGKGDFIRNGSPVELSASCRTLLSYLLLQRSHQASRPVLVELMAPEQSTDTARRRLNTTVWRLRRALEADGLPRRSIILGDADRLRINPECDIWVDVTAFELGCNRSNVPVSRWTPKDATTVAAAVKLYDGDLLEGVYDGWVLEQRSRLSDLRLASLVRLAEWYRRDRDTRSAVHYAEHAVAAEPLREDLHRLMISVYIEAGLHDLAVRQFDRCRRVLNLELGIEPLPETIQLAAQAVSRPTERAEHPLDVRAVVADLEAAAVDIERLGALVRRCLRTLATLPLADPPATSVDLSVIDTPEF